jgi:hypothetical protein|tara:strand:+ start:2372 stop:2845 length:474 start_codon:yes stop_codon:yes gene_type:complete
MKTTEKLTVKNIITIKQVLEAVEAETGLNLRGSSRVRELVYARSVYYKLCGELTSEGCFAIARLVGRHHATVLHGLKTFEVVAMYGGAHFDAYNKIKNSVHVIKQKKDYRDKFVKLLMEHRELLKSHRDNRREFEEYKNKNEFERISNYKSTYSYNM